MGNPEICMHGCTSIIRIAAHGCTHRGDKGTHDMRARFLHSCAWVCDCVVDRHAVMRACIRDRGAWRHPCREDRCTRMCAHGVDRHACMCTCGVDRHACMRACGLNKRALGARLMGAKLVFFGYFNVFYGQYG
jgi:hypothetical protein